MSGAIPPFHQYPFTAWCLVKHRETLPYYYCCCCCYYYFITRGCPKQRKLLLTEVNVQVAERLRNPHSNRVKNQELPCDDLTAILNLMSASISGLCKPYKCVTNRATRRWSNSGKQNGWLCVQLTTFY